MWLFLLISSFLVFVQLARTQPQAPAAHIITGLVLPTRCSPLSGDIYNIPAVGFYRCGPANTWTALGASGGSGITSINSSTTAAQVIAGTTNQLTVTSSGGTTTLSFPSAGVTLPSNSSIGPNSSFLATTSAGVVIASGASTAPSVVALGTSATASGTEAIAIGARTVANA